MSSEVYASDSILNTNLDASLLAYECVASIRMNSPSFTSALYLVSSQVLLATSMPYHCHLVHPSVILVSQQ